MDKKLKLNKETLKTLQLKTNVRAGGDVKNTINHSKNVCSRTCYCL